VVVINNENDAATIEFDVSRLRLPRERLIDQLGVSRPVMVHDNKMRVSLPKRSAAIFAGR
jgi:hypothetical protein